MTNSAKHTALPWVAQRDLRHSSNRGTLHDGSPKAWGIYGTYRVARIEEDIVPWDQDEIAQANAELIVRAVNAFSTIEQLARMTTPTDGITDQEKADDIMSDLDDETLCDAASTLYHMIRKAREIVSCQ